MAVFDINDLKKINDNLGHSAGDRIIKGAAEVITGIFGKENVYRFGGDEFLVVLETANEAELCEKMKELEQAVSLYNEAHAGEEGRLSVSSGCSCYHPETDKSFHDVFVRADESMYAKKQAYHEKDAGA